MKWRIYYADEETYSETDGTWLDAPARGVIAINNRLELVGREVEWGYDYYLWWPGADQPWGVDRAGLWDFLREVKSDIADERLENHHFRQLEQLGVKFGRSLSTPAFRQAINRVTDDPEFPVKTGPTRKELHDK